MVNGVKRTLLSQSTISLGANPGREMKVAAKTEEGAEYLLHTRFYDVDKRIYILQFLILKTDNDSTAAANAAKYFDSFKVLK
ncbi:MAG: hypothetical protein ABR557_00275 [Pyrinomonadaceae bacterium]